MDYQQPNSLSNVAKILGIVGLVTCMFGIGFIFGALAILFAIITRDHCNRFTNDGKTACILGVLSIVICIFVYVYIFTNPATYEILNQQCQAMYGMTFDEMLEQIKNGNAVMQSIAFGFRKFAW